MVQGKGIGLHFNVASVGQACRVNRAYGTWIMVVGGVAKFMLQEKPLQKLIDIYGLSLQNI